MFKRYECPDDVGWRRILFAHENNLSFARLSHFGVLQNEKN